MNIEEMDYHEIGRLFGRFNVDNEDNPHGCCCNACREWRRTDWRALEHGERKRWIGKRQYHVWRYSDGEIKVRETPKGHKIFPL